MIIVILFPAGLACVISRLRPENFPNKITCFLPLKTCQFQPKMRLFGLKTRVFVTKKKLFKVSNDFNSQTIYVTYETNNEAKVFVSNAL